MKHSSLSSENITEIIFLYQNSTQHGLLINIVNEIATEVELDIISDQAQQLMEIYHPQWAPDGPPQLLGGFLAKFLNEIREKYFLKKLMEMKDEIEYSLCEKLNFCEKLKTGKLSNDSVDLAIAICDGLMTYTTNFPLPIILTSVYITKNKLLPKFCHCD